MTIAVLTSGILPVPAVKGGAVENLIDFYLEYNNKYQLHDITVYSVCDEKTKHHPALQSKVNHYLFIEVNSKLAKIRKKLYHWFHQDEEYYHYSIEYYLHQAIKYIRRQQYDIIILENRPAYALRLRHITDAKLVYHLHNEKLDIETPKYQDIYDAATRILTVSNYIQGRVRTINSDDTKTQTIYNGIDLSVFSPKLEKKRNLHGLYPNDFVLVFSGRMNSDKGILELIESISLLKDYPDIKILVIGSSFFGNKTDESLFIKNLKEKATPFKDRIIFTGFIPYHQMPDYLKMADIAVVPSMWEEPFGLTVVEAMAAGLPLVTTRSGGIPEICEGVATIVDRKNIVNNLATAILDLYKHSEKRKQMATASLERSKLFDKETYARNYFAALESIG